MSIIEFNGSPYWSFDVSETGESMKFPWVGVVEGKSLTLSPLPMGILYSPQFRLRQRPRWWPSNSTIDLYDLAKKIGHCEQSTKWKKFVLIGQLAYKHRSIFSFCFTPAKYTDFLLAVHETKTGNLSIFAGYVSVRHSFRALRHHCCMFFVMGAQMPVHGGLKGCS